VPLGVTLDEALVRMEDAYLDRVAEAIGAEGMLASDTVIAAFGGAGPMTICGAARRAGVGRVIVPRTAAVFSAFGIGFSDLSQHYEHPLPATDAATVEDVARRLSDRARRDMFAEGVELDDCEASFSIVIERNGDSVAAPLDEWQMAEHVDEGKSASLELSLVAPLPHVAMGTSGEVSATPATASGTRAIRNRDGTDGDLSVYSLEDQPNGAVFDGPAIVEGPFFTMRLPDRWRLQTTATGDVMLSDERSE
jgi:N-methylhydantoinase A/oxoprolinase/acetone carboxylase beta subunit